jgi:alanine racemase
MWSVVKSNAYGHGLFVFSKLAERMGVDGFCVDTIVEGLALRLQGIKKPILILGFTLPKFLPEAHAKNIVATISNFEALKAIRAVKNPPSFHIKIDSGMHRQGFFLNDVPRVIRSIKGKSSLTGSLKGIYTHFSSAKDINYPTYTERQFRIFEKAARLFERAGFKNLIKHCAATGGTLLNKKYHQGAVRVGIGLCGLYPSKEFEAQLPKLHLKRVLSWRTIVTEIKNIPAGSFVGYDLVERVRRPTKIAVLPIG